MWSPSSRKKPMVWAAIFLIPLALWPQLSAAQEATRSEILLNRVEVLDMETAAKIALADSPTLAAAKWRVEQAAKVVKQAQSAYLPRLDATAGASRVDLSEREVQQQIGPFLALHIPVAMEDPQTYYQTGLSASWVVFDGFARKFNLAAARYGEQASIEARNDAERLLLAAVSFAFLEAQLARENIAIAKADAAFNNRLLTEARLRYDVGAGTLSDTLNFQIRGNEAQTQIIQNERAYQNALISLATLLGTPDGRLPQAIRLAEFTPLSTAELALPQVDRSLQTAFEKRPDLRQTQWAIRQAQAGIQTIKAGYYPSLALSATVSGQRPEDIGFETDDFGNTIALGLSWNLFDGGLTRAKHGEAKARLSEVEKIQQAAQTRIASEVQSNITLIQTAQQQVSLQQSNAQLVQQQRDLVEKEYKSGVGSLVRLNEAQRDLTVALGRLVLARVALREAWYNLQATTGQITELLSP